MKEIQISATDNITTVVINRSHALNALNQAVLDELQDFFKSFSTAETKGIILTGSGDKAFVAGADIKELVNLSESDALRLSKKGHAIFHLIENCPVPVIAAINGFALGGGCELAMACHMRIATENSKFGQPEVNLGLIPGYGGTQRLTQLVGRGKALELLLTGDMISAQEAKSLGLVNHVVPTKEELLPLAVKILEKISKKGPIAVKYVIESVNAGFAFEKEGYESEATNFAKCTNTSDFKEGTSAFIEKRAANFKGH